MWGCHQCLSEVKDLTGTMCARLPVGRVLFPSASSPGERAAMAQHVLSEARTLWSEKQGMEQTDRTGFAISASVSSLYKLKPSPYLT